jgi:hypothetical protein
MMFLGKLPLQQRKAMAHTNACAKYAGIFGRQNLQRQQKSMVSCYSANQPNKSFEWDTVSGFARPRAPQFQRYAANQWYK